MVTDKNDKQTSWEGLVAFEHHKCWVCASFEQVVVSLWPCQFVQQHGTVVGSMPISKVWWAEPVACSIFTSPPCKINKPFAFLASSPCLANCIPVPPQKKNIKPSSFSGSCSKKSCNQKLWAFRSPDRAETMKALKIQRINLGWTIKVSIALKRSFLATPWICPTIPWTFLA